LRTFSCSLGNIICLITKLMDFALTFLYNSVVTFFEYYRQSELQTVQPSVFLLPKEYTYAIIVASALGYIILLVYHKQEFIDGTLGLDEFKQSLTFRSLKFYTTRLLFVLGSSFTGLILNNSVNIFLCSSTDGTNYFAVADSTVECMSLSHISYMVASLLVVITYYPLAVVVFPYSSIIDRSKQIKYRAEFEVAYVQLKLVVGALLTLLSLKVATTKLSTINITTAVICLFLFALYYRLQPCSVANISKVEKPAYLLCVWLAIMAVLCEFVLFPVCLALAAGGIVGYLVYFIVALCRRGEVAEDDEWTKHIQDTLKSKAIKIGRIVSNTDAIKR